MALQLLISYLRWGEQPPLVSIHVLVAKNKKYSTFQDSYQSHITSVFFFLQSKFCCLPYILLSLLKQFLKQVQHVKIKEYAYISLRFENKIFASWVLMIS